MYPLPSLSQGVTFHDYSVKTWYQNQDIDLNTMQLNKMVDLSQISAGFVHTFFVWIHI